MTPPVDAERPERGSSRAADPDRGRTHETSLSAERRRRDGVHYTPREVAAELVACALDAFGDRRLPMMGDPSCGAGVFLMAAADELCRRGHGPTEVLTALWGMDIDAEAVALTRAAVRDWALDHGVDFGPNALGERIRVGDALSDPWPEGIDVVVGNPPFGGQLGGRTRRDESARAAAERIVGAPAGYLDTSALFLARAHREVSAEGVVVLMQPMSIIGAHHAAAVRDAVAGSFDGLWIGEPGLFDASVHVCAPVLRRRGGRLADRAWTAVAAERFGVPTVDLDGPELSTAADVTAGFRDEFYRVASAVTDAPADGTRPSGTACLVTVGLIDVGVTHWGMRPARMNRTRFERPLVCLTELRDETWFAARTVPKVLVATQTRVVEAVADDTGELWPSVPVISILPRGHVELDLLLAAVLSPPVAAWAVGEAIGTGRSRDAVRLSAALVGRIPLPTDAAAWRRGAELLAAGARPTEWGSVLCEAHGIVGRSAEELMGWWESRLPRR